jgi:hypothetical protein
MIISEVSKYNDPSGNVVPNMVRAVIDGEVIFVAVDPSDTKYAEILRQVEAGELTIADAD